MTNVAYLQYLQFYFLLKTKLLWLVTLFSITRRSGDKRNRIQVFIKEIKNERKQ